MKRLKTESVFIILLFLLYNCKIAGCKPNKTAIAKGNEKSRKISVSLDIKRCTKSSREGVLSSREAHIRTLFHGHTVLVVDLLNLFYSANIFVSGQRIGAHEGLDDLRRDHIAPGWAVSLELISSKEAVGFYQKRGFEERPCDWDGSGMFKMIR